MTDEARKDCVRILDDLQSKYRARLREATDRSERMYWEGYLSALTMAARTIEEAERNEH